MMDNKSFKSSLQSKRCFFSLACSIGSMSLACGSLLQIPNTTDRISLQRGLVLTSLGFIYFVSLTDFCNKYLLETSHGITFRKKYHLMMSDVMEITNKIVSAVQAYFSFLVGFLVCKSTCTKSFLYASHFLMEAYGWFGTAYFMYDIWSMYKVHTQKIADKLKLMRLTSNSAFAKNGRMNGRTSYGKRSNELRSRGKNGNGRWLLPVTVSTKHPTDSNQLQSTEKHIQHHEGEISVYDGENVQIPKGGRWDFFKYMLTHPVMMIHHIFIGTFGLLVVTYIRGGGHCIYSYIFMMEFSTPFVSLRSILSTMGLKDSRAYIINGLVMLGTFFVCRIFMWPYVMYRYSVAINTTFWQAVTTLPRGCIVSILILFLPQLYWFFLMIKGALKVLISSKEKPKSLERNQHNFVQENPQSKNNNLSPVDNNSIEFHHNHAEFTKNLTNNCNANSSKGGISDESVFGRTPSLRPIERDN